jgi:hypothetical protein
MRKRPSVPNHFIMRLQTNSKRRRIFCEQSAEWILLFLPVMCELPIFKRSQRQRQSGCFGKDALIIAKQPRTHQHVDQLLIFTAIGALRRGVRHGSKRIIVRFPFPVQRRCKSFSFDGETPPYALLSRRRAITLSQPIIAVVRIEFLIHEWRLQHDRFERGRTVVHSQHFLARGLQAPKHDRSYPLEQLVA